MTTLQAITNTCSHLSKPNRTRVLGIVESMLFAQSNPPHRASSCAKDERTEEKKEKERG
jgi:hypothetical protein